MTRIDEQLFNEWVRQEQNSYYAWALMNLPFPSLSPEEVEKRLENEKMRMEIKERLKWRHPKLKWIEAKQ